jgi:hypothetical protein
MVLAMTNPILIHLAVDRTRRFVAEGGPKPRRVRKPRS